MTRSRFALFIFALIFFTVLLVKNSYADIRGLPSITVLAPSSLTQPITELITIYSRSNNITVTATYGATPEQASRISDGEPGDVFISAHPSWMLDLKQKGLIDVYSLTNLVKNQLTLVASKNSFFKYGPVSGNSLASKLSYVNSRSIMVIGDPNETALGLYTKETITNLDNKNGTNLWQSFDRKTIKSSNSQNNLYLISHGETAGITYYSDAYNNPEVAVIATINDDLHDPIIYQAAVVAGENMTLARGFLKFISSTESKAIFRKYGFSTE